MVKAISSAIGLFVFLSLTLFDIAVVSAQVSVRVIDGDTIELGGIPYRLFGIDAPEAGQICAAAGARSWPCGRAAIAKVESLVLGHAVSCDDRGRDAYGRTLAVCLSDGLDIGRIMVQEGEAWSFRRYSTHYASDEDDARARKVGIWQAPSQPAWEFRAQRWETAKQQAPEGCPVKGNVTVNGRIYHAPWSPWYSRTSIDPSKGERWFCSEADAVAAGWRAPYWGR